MQLLKKTSVNMSTLKPKLTILCIIFAAYAEISFVGNLSAEQLNPSVVLELCADACRNRMSTNGNAKGFHCNLEVFPDPEENDINKMLEPFEIDVYYRFPEQIRIEVIGHVLGRVYLIMGFYNKKALLFNPDTLIFEEYILKKSPKLILKEQNSSIVFELEFETNEAEIIDIDIYSILRFFIDSKNSSLITDKANDGRKIHIGTFAKWGKSKWITGKIGIFADNFLPYLIHIYLFETENIKFKFKQLVFSDGEWPDEIFQVPRKTIEKLFTIVEAGKDIMADRYKFESDYFARCCRSLERIGVLDYEPDEDGKVKPKYISER